VALGGRWHEIEKENRALALEVHAWQSEAASALKDRSAAQQEQLELQSEVASSQQACQASKAEIADLHGELAFLRQTLAEAAETSAGHECRIDEVGSLRDSLQSECAALRQNLSEEETEASKFQALAARAEVKAAR
jgi:chromosome segregation ATPase